MESMYIHCPFQINVFNMISVWYEILW
jgi:hypothetical protein